MMAARCDDQCVQFLKVVVVPGENDAVFTNSVRQVDRIRLPTEPGRYGKHHVMTGAAQQRRQERACQVIIYVDSEG